MPWSQGPVDERMEAIELWKAGWAISEIARLKRISRQCLYKWLDRYERDGLIGLMDQSRAPHGNSRKIPDEIVEELLALKKETKACGPTTLADMLNQKYGRHVISRSAAAAIVARHGLVRRTRRRGRGGVDPTAPLIQPIGSGHTITGDHKGRILLSNGAPCHPLTLADPASRFIYAIEALRSTAVAPALRVFERVFREWGVPEQIVTDNGVPFCAPAGLGGLTDLTKYWLKLGIQVRRIQPGKPQQNAIHERMHRTLKAAVCREPAASFRGQQRLFDAFRSEYNERRPHRGLNGQVPGSLVRPCTRSYPRRVEVHYPEHFEVRRVRSNGQFKWHGQLLFLTETLINENIGLELVDDGVWDIYFGTQRLASYDRRTGELVRAVNDVPRLSTMSMD